MTPKTDTEKTVLVLQGGGALGSYQAGAVEEMDARGLHPDWVAGISIGAINAAIMAGNPPETRVAQLRKFWTRITANTACLTPLKFNTALTVFNNISATATMTTGAPGFFKPRVPPAVMRLPGQHGADSYYDTSELRETLLEMVDFDRINNGPTRLSVGAVNVATGNMTWFDSARDTIRPEHIMASGALPPGFPAVEIDGQFYWDGGLVSNTPLKYVLDHPGDSTSLCIFQIDLFNARGPVPQSVWDIDSRIKDIRYSSRTRFNTEMMKRLHQQREAAERLYKKLPKELQNDPDARALLCEDGEPDIAIVHLIYRQAQYEGGSKDYEFSRNSMLDRWAAGREDVMETLTHPDWKNRHNSASRIGIFDLAGDRWNRHRTTKETK
ncbi:patatin-like phospholipase family protein [Neptunicoccus sediminis]|uniref:patatin-like phospholipase family protein n=1 Tax=Neptunicoccus sediminis TaxID=1892596 RepID=UPI000845E18F|nr:patatin-like phospholipase family protein [Neptunicoccus sediminis]